MSFMFGKNYCKIIVIYFYEWDTSKVTNMSHMFEGCNNIEGISNWDTSNVTDMSYMFRNYQNISDIQNWNTSKIQTMSHMFKYVIIYFILILGKQKML